MQAEVIIDAPADLTGCSFEDIDIYFGLVCTGRIAVSIRLSNNIDWSDAIAAIESGVDKTLYGDFGGIGGIEIKDGMVTIMSADNIAASTITISAPAEECLPAFRIFRATEREFMTDPYEFVRKHRGK